ncbi:hypothetical protein GO755_34195 [Spirosoma sp. HMF4905]|uniref:Uncharacterized protein n=1 Tax=Spirosoma arboris TaxID=2682092 RepID=A0A7K1SMY8_9BACT|nr:hypothetical protein [Spirosoma arboris]MVM35127.1 hypothetical protein [Spirosoma arboris]
MENTNPFKELESDAICPPNLKTELVSEIDLIRNVITIIDLYIGDLFDLASAIVNPPYVTSDNTTPPL